MDMDDDIPTGFDDDLDIPPTFEDEEISTDAYPPAYPQTQTFNIPSTVPVQPGFTPVAPAQTNLYTGAINAGGQSPKPLQFNFNVQPVQSPKPPQFNFNVQSPTPAQFNFVAPPMQSPKPAQFNFMQSPAVQQNNFFNNFTYMPANRGAGKLPDIDKVWEVKDRINSAADDAEDDTKAAPAPAPVPSNGLPFHFPMFFAPVAVTHARRELGKANNDFSAMINETELMEALYPIQDNYDPSGLGQTRCLGVLRTGANSGKQCTTMVSNGNYCGKHAGYKKCSQTGCNSAAAKGASLCDTHLRLGSQKCSICHVMQAFQDSLCKDCIRLRDLCKTCGKNNVVTGRDSCQQCITQLRRCDFPNCINPPTDKDMCAIHQKCEMTGCTYIATVDQFCMKHTPQKFEITEDQKEALSALGLKVAKNLEHITKAKNSMKEYHLKRSNFTMVANLEDAFNIMLKTMC